jgi:hypothetical protein
MPGSLLILVWRAGSFGWRAGSFHLGYYLPVNLNIKNAISEIKNNPTDTDSRYVKNIIPNDDPVSANGSNFWIKYF